MEEITAKKTDEMPSLVKSFAFSPQNISFESNQSSNINSSMEDTVLSIGKESTSITTDTNPVSHEIPSVSEPPSEKSNEKAVKSVYYPHKKFANREELSKYFNDSKCFSWKSDNKTNEGTMSYYICSQVPKRQASKCPVKSKVFASSETRDFCVFVTTFDHNHVHIESKRNPVSQELKDIYI